MTQHPSDMNLERFLLYNRHGNEIFLNQLAVMPDDNPALPRLVPLMAHILFAQYVWACRIEEKAPRILLSDLEVKPSAEGPGANHSQNPSASLDRLSQTDLNLFTLNKQLYEIFRSYLNDDPQRLVQYKNLKNEICSNTLGDILLHVCNHGTHHRAQMALLMRQNGLTPPPSDYIFLAREGLLIS